MNLNARCDRAGSRRELNQSDPPKGALTLHQTSARVWTKQGDRHGNPSSKNESGWMRVKLELIEDAMAAMEDLEYDVKGDLS